MLFNYNKFYKFIQLSYIIKYVIIRLSYADGEVVYMLETLNKVLTFIGNSYLTNKLFIG